MPDSNEIAELTSLQGITESQADRTREILEEKFWRFCMATMDVVPGTDQSYFDPRFHTEFCNFLQAGYEDPECDEILVILPRGFIKTQTMARFMLWTTLKSPGRSNLSVCNTLPNAKSTNRIIRLLVESNPIIQLCWPELIPEFRSRWNDEYMDLARDKTTKIMDMPNFRAAGVGTQLTKTHWNTIWEDDTDAPDVKKGTEDYILPTREEINKAINFHTLALPLLVSPGQPKNAGDLRIVTGTRWAVDDLKDHIINTGLRWVFDRSALYEDGTPRYYRYDMTSLDRIRKSMGPFMYQMLFMNQPMRPDDLYFRPEWFREWVTGELPNPADCRRVMCIDPADPPTEKTTVQSFSALVTAWHHAEKGSFVLHCRKGRWTLSDMVKRALDLALHDSCDTICIEVDRYPHVAPAFRDAISRRNLYISIREVKTRGKQKDARIFALQPFIEQGRLHFPQGSEGKLVLDELVQFPHGKFKDVADALAWHLHGGYLPEMRHAVLSEKPRYKGTQVKLDDILSSLDQQNRAERRYKFTSVGW